MSKTNQKIRKALKKINKENGGQKMTIKAQKRNRSEKEIKRSLNDKSFTIAGTDIRIEYQLVTPKMAANMLENNYEDGWGVDPHWQSQCEKAIFLGLNTDESTNFLICIDSDGLFVDGTCVLAAIVEVNKPAVVGFATNIPEGARVLIDYEKEGQEKYTVMSHRALDIKDDMEHILAEFYQTERNNETLKKAEHDPNSLSAVYYRIFDSFNFLPRRKYAIKVAKCESVIRENTLGTDVEWFAVCWMLAELNGKDAPFFHAIAYNKPELCADAQKYMEKSTFWLENLATMSDESFKNAKAGQKIKLKFYAENVYNSWLNEIRKAS